MKRYLIHYWDGAVKKWYTKVPCKQAAVEKFREHKGNLFVMAIEEVKEERPQYQVR